MMPSKRTATIFRLPWWNFAALRPELLKIFNSYGLMPGDGLAIGQSASALLKQSKRNADGYSVALSTQGLSEADLLAKLSGLGFVRQLSAEQLRNVRKIASLPAAATSQFLEPGKRPEALACFFYRAQSDEKLLVVAPKNAFAAWDKQIADCLPSLRAKFVRLRAGRENIAKLLTDDPRYMLITYQRLVRVADLMAAHCASRKVHIFLMKVIGSKAASQNKQLAQLSAWHTYQLAN